jgi:hypothetical protein
VVDPLRVQQVEGLLHVLGRPLLTGVRDQVQAVRGGPGVDVGEQARRIADLGRVQPDADEPVAERQCPVQRGHGRVRTEVTQEAQDEVRGDGGPRVGDRPGQPLEHRLDRHPGAGVRLRVEEDLRPPDARLHRPVQVRAGQVVEVLTGPQHAHARVVQVKELLQAAEPVPGTQFGDVGGRQRNLVPRRERDEKLGLERPLDVQMQFSDRKHAEHSIFLATHPPSPRVNYVIDFARAGQSRN